MSVSNEREGNWDQYSGAVEEDEGSRRKGIDRYKIALIVHQGCNIGILEDIES